MDAAAQWRAFDEGARFAQRFFMERSDVHLAMVQLAQRLDAAGIPYAVAGAMALNAYGYRRVTTDVDVLMTETGLQAFKEQWLGRGYVERFPGSRGMTDTVNRVRIDVLVSGAFPGDGEPKPVCFPDPGVLAASDAPIRFLPLESLIELKLVRGMTAPHRLKDLADVMELIKSAHLGRGVAERLDPYVQARYLELWDAAQGAAMDEL